MQGNNWPGEWLRGVLEVSVLRVLSDGASYGYAIAQRLAQAGYGDIKGGTLYPLLSRLESSGLVTTHWAAGEGGPGRKFFELTPAGRERSDALSDDWGRFAELTSRFVTHSGSTQ
ncbi:PadR family transcriptional regulator [Nigerium massiliense]|uniref:PadR family transcriptional regulator n=1 Tax=Nigerium massiliense TaxID=1522317 RepID=UPI00058C687B|nr:PadR family transcriptional regulator [Nigerium massiliense]